MRRSVFCVCPPGNTQDSARVWRAITFGCIPVTFFRAFDLPFQRHMGMPYADFVLNIQPDDYRQLNTRIQAILDNPSQLRRMQVRIVKPLCFHRVRLSQPTLLQKSSDNIEVVILAWVTI